MQYLIIDHDRFGLSCLISLALLFSQTFKLFGFPIIDRGHRSRDHVVVGFTTTYTLSAYHHWSCQFEFRSWRGVLDTTLCEKVCQWLAVGGLFFSEYSANKTDLHDTEILLKVTLSTITLTPNHWHWAYMMLDIALIHLTCTLGSCTCHEDSDPALWKNCSIERLPLYISNL